MWKYAPYVIIVVLLASLIISLTNNKQEEIIKTTSDTITIVKLDTVKVKIPTFIKETIVDTIYLQNAKKDGYMIPISQRYYKGNDYEAWVSGYKPNLDSINLFQKNTINTITNTTTKEVYPKITDLYMNIGFDIIDNAPAPNLGLTVKFKRNFILDGHIGLHNKDIYYGLKLGFKLNSKNGK